jgi:hypothetical protein
LPDTIFSRSPFRGFALLLIITLSAAAAVSQTPAPARPLLPARLGTQWKAINEARTLDRDQASLLPDADVYTEYGLQWMVTRDYASGAAKYTIELFALNYTSGAYGLRLHRRAVAQPNRQEFQHGRYLVSLSGGTAGADSDPALVEAIKESLPDAAIGEFPTLPAHLPESGKLAGSERYLLGPLALAQLPGLRELKDVVLFTGGAEAAAASYQNGSGQMEVLIVEYLTPQLASDGFAKLQAHFDSLPPGEQAKRILKRIGNYAVEAVNVQDRTAADMQLGQIKYTQRVYWEGKKLSDIPIQFRPTDDAAIEEATQTANVLIRTFYWIGIMLTSALILGLLAGGSFFYAKRYFRRKRGLDNLFSDAGGTVRLNLDEYLLQSSQKPIQKIGKGNNDQED